MLRTPYGRSAALTATAILIGTTWWTLRAQEGRGPTVNEPVPEANAKIRERSSTVSVQEALIRPFDLPFAEETSLAEVARKLGEVLNAQVVLDQAALDRQNVTEDDTVRLELQGVRLKTGLRLLLGQVGLTYQVVPEDNLLIITDAQESGDRYSQVLDELKALHRDVHTLQDTLDELLGEEDADDHGHASRAVPIAREL